MHINRTHQLLPCRWEESWTVCIEDVIISRSTVVVTSKRHHGRLSYWNQDIKCVDRYLSALFSKCRMIHKYNDTAAMLNVEILSFYINAIPVIW